MLFSPAYGQYGTTPDDAHVQAAERAMRSISNAMRPGSFYLVEMLPFLKYLPAWLPGAAFKRVALEGRMRIRDMRFRTWEWSLRQYTDGKIRPSFFTRLMESHQGGNITLDMVRDCCAVLHSGA